MAEMITGKMPKQSAAMALLGGTIRRLLSTNNNSDLEQNREEALKYYNGAPRGDEVAGRSGVISMDVADATNAFMAQAMPMLSADNIVEFEPNGEADEETVRAETMAVGSQIMEMNDGFTMFETALKDAALLRTGIVKVWVDERQEVNRADVSGQEPAQIASHIEDADPNEVRELVGDKIVSTRTIREFRCAAVDPTLFFYQANWPTNDLERCPFVAEKLYYTRSELVEMGFSKETIYSLPSDDGVYATDTVQRNKQAVTDTDQGGASEQWIACHEAYVTYDLDGDGIGERLKVLIAAESYVLEQEEVPFVPYAVGSLMITPHRMVGESIFDRLKGVQDTKTAAQRQWIDNLTLANNARTILNDAETSLSDALDSKPGGVVRSRNPNGVIPFPFLDTGPSNMALLAYMNDVRTEAVGAALEMGTAPAQLANVAASAVERQYSSKELVVSLMTRNFAESVIRRAYQLMHKTMRLFANEPLAMQISGSWQEVDPRGWPDRKRVNVKTGLSIGQRAHAQGALAQAIQLQVAAMNQGMNGVLADATTIYRTYINALTLAGIESPERYAIDPSSEAAAQAGQANAQAAQQAQQVQMQTAEAMIETERGKTRQKQESDAGKLEFDYWNARLQAQLKEAEVLASATRDFELEAMKGEQSERAAKAAAANGAADRGGDN